MTFWHWSSVTPYTSSYEFAGSCVFGKQLPGKLSLRPILRWAGLIPKVRPLFCRVPWSTLTCSPCSTRADHLCRFAVRSYIQLSLEVFLGRLFTMVQRARKLPVPHFDDSCIKAACRIFLAYLSHKADVNPIRRHCLFPPSLHHLYAGQGILTLCPSGAVFTIPLGPTNPWLINIAKETLIFRRAGISPALRLLVPAFSLRIAPPWLAPLASLQYERSLTTCTGRSPCTSSASVLRLNPDYLRRRDSR